MKKRKPKPLKLADHCETCSKKVKPAKIHMIEGKLLCSNCYRRGIIIMPQIPQLFKEPLNRNVSLTLNITNTQNDLLKKRLEFLFPLKKGRNKCEYLRLLFLADLAHWKNEMEKKEKDAQLNQEEKRNFEDKFIINELEFRRTGFMCPEQYEVFRNNVQVAYIRLRWGHLSVTYLDYNGDLIFEHKFKDNLRGAFPTGEREKWLEVIAEKIVEYIQRLGE